MVNYLLIVLSSTIMANGTVDLEGTIKKWAKKMFDITKTKEQGRIPENTLDFVINWKKVRAIHEEPQFEGISHTALPKAQVLFKTHFTNNTDAQQAYSFKTERASRSTCDVTVEKGVSMGYEMGIKFKTPYDVLEANAGFKREVVITEGEGKSTEEQMIWTGDCQVTVPPQHQATAELVINEQQYSSRFTVESRVRGNIHVSVYDRRTDSFVQSIDGNLAEIIGHYDVQDVTLKGKWIRFQTIGKCQFRYAVEQHVKLDQESLEFGMNN